MAVLKKIFSSLQKIFWKKKQRRKTHRKIRGKPFSSRRAPRKPSGKSRPGRSFPKKSSKKRAASSIKPSSRSSSVLSVSANRLKSPSAGTRRRNIPALPPGQLIGEVTHFFSKIQVVVVKMGKGNLAVGDKIRIHGHHAPPGQRLPAGRRSTDFTQTVRSLQIESVDVRCARGGQLVGLKVEREAKVGDKLYKLV